MKLKLGNINNEGGIRDLIVRGISCDLVGTAKLIVCVGDNGVYTSYRRTVLSQQLKPEANNLICDASTDIVTP